MFNSKLVLRLILIILIIFYLASYLSSQIRMPSEEDRMKQWKKWLNDFPVPKDAIELEFQFSFPSESLLEKGIFLWWPRQMIPLADGNIVVADQKACQLFMFDNRGNFIRNIGKKGEGPGEFMNPFCMSATSEKIIVSDTKNMRVQFYNIKGDYLRSFKIFKAYMDIAIGKDEMIYAVPLRIDPASKLVDVLDKNGQLLSSFGKARFGSDNSQWQAANWITISLNEKEELYIAYDLFPLVVKYSKEGALLAEYRIEHKAMQKKEKNNLDHVKLKTYRGGWSVVIPAIYASKDGFYILQNYPRIEILEYDSNGKFLSNYFFDIESYDVHFRDFFVIEKEGKKTFYLLKMTPENEIVILRPKEIKAK